MGACSLLADAVRASIMMPNRRRRRRACAKFFLSCLVRAFDGCSLGTDLAAATAMASDTVSFVDVW